MFELRNFPSIGSNQSNSIMNRQKLYPLINSMPKLNDDKMDDGFDVMSPDNMFLCKFTNYLRIK